MKKCFVTVITLMLMIAVSACGSSKNENSQQNETKTETASIDTASSLTTEDSTQDEKKTWDSSLLPGGYKIPLEDIYFSVPNYHETELTGYTEQFSVYNEKYVTITGDGDVKASSCKNAYEVCSELFLKAVDYSSAKEFRIEHEEIVNINGIEMYKFEGILYHELGRHDLYTIGYAFVMGDIACQITGVVEDENQPENMIEELKNVVNEMAKSVRTVQ